MIEYVFAHDPDDRIIDKAKNLLKDGHIIIFPTDTNWVLACDPFQKKAVESLYKLKGEERSHHFSLLCLDLSKASELAYIPDKSFRLIRNKIPGHYTFIFEASKKVIKAIKASKTDHQIGLRFVPEVLVTRLLEAYGGPLISSNLDSSLLGRNLEDGDVFSYEIEEALGSRVGLIIDPGELHFAGTSTIYDLREDVMELVRAGAGEEIF